MTRKSRKGRPRKQNVNRTKSGRISRSAVENPMQVAIEARQRIHGLTAELAKDPLSCTVLGRLYLAKQITETARRAGETLLEWHIAAMKAIKAPDGLAKGGGKSADGDIASEDYIDWATRAVTRWEVAKDWIERFNKYSAMEVYRVCLDDVPPTSSIMLVGGLNYLAKRMGIVAAVREAAE